MTAVPAAQSKRIAPCRSGATAIRRSRVPRHAHRPRRRPGARAIRAAPGRAGTAAICACGKPRESRRIRAVVGQVAARGRRGAVIGARQAVEEFVADDLPHARDRRRQAPSRPTPPRSPGRSPAAVRPAAASPASQLLSARRALASRKARAKSRWISSNSGMRGLGGCAERSTRRWPASSSSTSSAGRSVSHSMSVGFGPKRRQASSYSAHTSAQTRVPCVSIRQPSIAV